MKYNQFIITGIGTDVGKTVVSAIVSQALDATYWKPIQAGDLDNSDSIKVNRLTSDSVKVLPELYAFSTPASPHYAASIENISINLDKIEIPEHSGNLIIEGAGGLMVPIDFDGTCYIDVFKKLDVPVILVSRHYLGSINHTLLSYEALKNCNLKIEGIIFVGDENEATERVILNKTKLPMILRVPLTENINSSFILEQADRLKETEHYRLWKV